MEKLWFWFHEINYFDTFIRKKKTPRPISLDAKKWTPENKADNPIAWNMPNVFYLAAFRSFCRREHSFFINAQSCIIQRGRGEMKATKRRDQSQKALNLNEVISWNFPNEIRWLNHFRFVILCCRF